MSLTDAQVAEIAGMTTGTSLGGRARDLAREVQASRKLIADLRALHGRSNEMPDYCAACAVLYPCPTIRMIEEAGL